MSNIPKEVLKNYIKEQNFSNPNEVLAAMKEMFRDVLQEALEAEMDEQLGYDRYDMSDKETPNRRNGYSKKTIKSELGPVDLNIPRDRHGDYDPKIIPKYQRNVTGIEEKVMALYAAGMTTRDISEQIKNLYDVDISADMVSNITNRILPLVSEWQNRPLEKRYSFVFMDAIHYKVREDKQVVVKAAYVVLGVNMDGVKEVLGIWIGANESSKFWLSVLNDLKNRGVQEVLIFCVDGLSGFKEAIGAVYPFAQIQRCIIHQLRASMRYIPYKDKKAFVADLKAVYTSVNEEMALENLLHAKEKWCNKYPNAIKSWEDNWDNISTFLMFPDYIRRIMYTTNAIESLNSQFRKVTKTKLIFPTDESLMKMLYLATERVSKKWTRGYGDWDRVLSQLNILFKKEDVV
ncbi:IS256 family transposase [Clostridium formicaceticum]|uniref:Mutator family transposase n=1 Tax=Clostridium formicaceticum TaxID=1497 RepID=A0A1D9FL65_9CLOT|nr:IS256 family transposase [Clostridium formicaceticum]AOY76136.1 IS256 family transposase [Clostridium formicaceticum]AOY77705.1 IS256 family transposase [Clostridium formicaceticum]AOY78091.1 IS256 family transposase [Clostridium formicaceticum]ARE86504.1 Transposase, Mutator family [Clostridium formicaceticum]ARE88293.1 Transposase, Mutator family [Clostridium formicaceticum]